MCYVSFFPEPGALKTLNSLLSSRSLPTSCVNSFDLPLDSPGKLWCPPLWAHLCLPASTTCCLCLSKWGGRSVQPDNTSSSPTIRPVSFQQSMHLHGHTWAMLLWKIFRAIKFILLKNDSKNTQSIHRWSLDIWDYVDFNWFPSRGLIHCKSHLLRVCPTNVMYIHVDLLSTWQYSVLF